MNSRQQTRPPTVQLVGPNVLCPETLTIVLAYIQKEMPRRIQDARLLPAKDLRALARWIGTPAPTLRSIRKHKLLAGHIALLDAAGLLTTRSARLALQPEAVTWIFAGYHEQLDHLLMALEDGVWQAALERLGLKNILTIDYAAYLRQTLQRQLRTGAPAATNMPELQRKVAAQRWLLWPIRRLPSYFLFELLQLGEWDIGGDTLVMTPLSLSHAAQNGYAFDHVCSLLQQITGNDLEQDARSQLMDWMARSHDYNISAVTLLETAEPDQLATLMRHRRLRRHILRQIGPRHALVARKGIAQIRRWLANRDYSLSTFLQSDVADAPEPELDAGSQWLALRLIGALGELIPLPYAPPNGALQALGERITPERQHELEELCRKTIASLRQAIAGRDAFFPADRCPSPSFLNQIEEAIKNEETLTLDYRALGQEKARRRRVYPFRLEQRGQLFYLHGYCTLARQERTFRLDRVCGLRPSLT